MARPVRSASTSATVVWNEAQRSAMSWSPTGPGGRPSIAMRTRVFSPEKEKSQPGRPFIGCGRSNRAGSPDCAAFSTAGPPG